jgi:hypothetical protein
MLARIYTALFVIIAQPAATAPTQPATTQSAIDLTSPKSAMRALSRAMESGDASSIEKILYGQGDQDQKMIAATVAIATATSNLHRAAVSTFGEKGAKGLIGDSVATAADATAQIEAATEKIENDYATLTLSKESQPLVLRKIQGQWRIPVAQLAQNANPAALNERLAELAAQTAVISEVATDLTSGKFHSGEDAAETLHAKMMKTAMQHTATNPTTSTTRRSD